MSNLLDLVIIQGKGIELDKAIFDSLNEEKSIILGNKEVGVTLDEIQSKLQNKIGSSTVIIIYAHGNLNKITKIHQISLSDNKNFIATSDILVLLKSLGNEIQNIYLFSCYSGNAIMNIDVLTKGSVLITTSKKDHVSFNLFDNKLIQAMAKNRERKNPYQNFLENINNYAINYGSFITHAVEFSLTPSYEVLLDHKNALNYLEKESERFIELTKLCEWNGENLHLVPRKFTKDDIKDFINGFFVCCSGIGEKSFILFLKKHLINNNKLQQLLNNHSLGVPSICSATSNDKVTMVRYLIKAGADLNLVYIKDRSTPLSIASYKGYVRLVRLLIESKAKLDLKDNQGRSALWLAVSRGKLEVVRCLIKAGANINLTNIQGVAPLSVVSISDHDKLAKLLIRADTKIDMQDNLGRTALWFASNSGAEKVVRYLIKSGAKVNLPNINNCTFLAVASANNHKRIAKLLIKAGAKIDLQDVEGKSALWHASEKGNIDIVKYLIKYGAKLDLKNLYGNSPFDIALENNHKKVARILTPIKNPANNSDDGQNINQLLYQLLCKLKLIAYIAFALIWFGIKNKLIFRIKKLLANF